MSYKPEFAVFFYTPRLTTEGRQVMAELIPTLDGVYSDGYPVDLLTDGLRAAFRISKRLHPAMDRKDRHELCQAVVDELYGVVRLEQSTPRGFC